ncbi:MAG: alpha/beta hydrolase [Pseudomonadota bacterium]
MQKIIWWVPVLALVAVLAVPLIRANGSPAFAVANLPTLGFRGEVHRNVVFDAETGLALDLYVPVGPGPHPVVVFFYGGRWSSGRKEDYAFVATDLAAQGVLVAVPDYRTYPDVRFPTFVEDAAAATAHLVRTIGERGGDPAHITLAGHSAGAHIAALLVSDARYLAAHGLRPVDLAGFVGLAGPYHFVPRAEDLVEIFGPAERFPEMQAGGFVSGDEPPILMLYGLADETVGPVNIERMEEALAAVGGCWGVRRYPDVDHVGIIAAFSWTHRARMTVAEDVAAFAGAPDAHCTTP